jgi:SAM-dependent methyltransferase
MRDISFREEFDRALLLFTSFGYFSDEDNFKVLKNVATALKPGGLFCLDIMNRDSTLKNFRPYSVNDKDSNLQIERNSFDSLTGRLYNKRIVIRNGVRRDKPFFVRLYSLGEIRDLLHRANLELQNVYGGWESEDLTLNSRNMVIIARKII